MTRLTTRWTAFVLMISLILVVLVAATNLSIADDKKPAAGSARADDKTMVSTFDGERIRLSESLQFLLFGAHGSEVTSIDGKTAFRLPGRLNLRMKTKRGPTALFTLTGIKTSVRPGF